MIKRIIYLFLLAAFFLLNIARASSLPVNFVYLRDIDPTIIQDIRYATSNNFIGHPVKGYEAPECILTKPTALALAQIQKELKNSNLSLKVYDCYRPEMAVEAFVNWSRISTDQKMKAEFFPRVDKSDFFKLGYVAEKSGHSRGSTVDLTIVSLPIKHHKYYHFGRKLISCYAPYADRMRDNSLDMGTNFDCMDKLARNDNKNINVVAYYNRQLLKAIMKKHGFKPYEPEWWHFTMRHELYPKKYFNFPVVSKNGQNITLQFKIRYLD